MWDHLPVHNLIHMQQIAAMKALERQMVEDARAGYDTDVLLERWEQLRDQIGKPIA